MPGDVSRESDGEQRVNNLNAAAYDLLESLKNLLSITMIYYRSLPDDGTEQDHLMTYYIEPARIAIAKAEGRNGR